MDVATVQVDFVVTADGRTEFLSGGLVVESVVLFEDGGCRVYRKEVIFPWTSDHYYYSLT